MLASEVVAANEIHPGHMEPAAQPPAGGRSMGQLTQTVQWVTTALAISMVATAMWLLSEHASAINLRSVEAMHENH